MLKGSSSMQTSVATSRPELRYYQKEIVDAVASALADGGSGQIHMACGSGKTLVGHQAAERLLPGRGTVAVLVPSVALAAQTLKSWLRFSSAALETIAVCGDEKVADSAAKASELKIPVTTDVAELTALLKRPCARLRLVLCTNRSAAVLAEAVRATGGLDLLILDEAHHLTGSIDKANQAILDPEFLPARRRLFMTATPRLNTRTGDVEKAKALIGMDDESVFGPILGRYSFAQGIADGYLSDYRVVVICVRDSEARSLLSQQWQYVDSDEGPPLEMAVAQVALARAHQEYGIRKVLTFHRLVKDAERFATTLRPTIFKMAPNQYPGLYAGHVHGEMDHDLRDKVLEPLAAKRAGWAVVSSARCLSEGVDLPAVDAVLFTAVKRSEVDIAQAAGRALRPDPEAPGPSLIILPYKVRDAEEDAVEEADSAESLDDVDLGGLEHIVNVVRAMRAHDETLAAGLDEQRRCRHDPEQQGFALPDKLRIQMAEGDSERFLQAVSLRLLKETTVPWWEGYHAAEAFYKEHGHLLVSRSYVDADGFAVGRWISSQRGTASRARSYPEYRDQLDAIGMVWDPKAARQAEYLEAAEAFHRQHGHLDVPAAYENDKGLKLGVWIGNSKRRDNLPAAVTKRLEALGLERNRLEGAWERSCERVRQYKQDNGHPYVPFSYVTPDGEAIGNWLSEQVRAHQAGTLSEKRSTALKELGVDLGDSRDSRKSRMWARCYPAAVAYHAEHGNLEVPRRHVTPDGVNLGNWISSLRQADSGQIPRTVLPEQRTALDALGMRWGARQIAATSAAPAGVTATPTYSLRVDQVADIDSASEPSRVSDIPPHPASATGTPATASLRPENPAPPAAPVSRPATEVLFLPPQLPETYGHLAAENLDDLAPR
jgi:superfamily II DNA or RNA helicase